MIKNFFLLTISLLLCGALLLYFRVPIVYSSKQQPLIVCTTTIIADTVSALSGDTLQIKTLMGPGVDPHIYRPRESDVTALAQADLIVYNGLHLEGKMGDLFVHMRERVPTIAAADALSSSDFIATDYEGMYDPHIWHDVSLWMKVVPYLCATLVKLYPEKKEYFEKNSRTYLEQLAKTHAYVCNRCAELPRNKRRLFTAHDAFNYFGCAYGFDVVGLQGMSTDAVVSTHDIQQMANQIASQHIPAIFLEASIPPKSIEAVCNAVESRGWHVMIAPELFSDSLGDSGTTADTYCGMIKHNIDVIIDSLTS